jgi:hypothetical protein
MVSKGDPRFRQSRAAGRSCKKLDAEFRFEPDEPPADHRFGNAEPPCGGRNSPGTGNFNECPEIFDFHVSVPHFATQLGIKAGYRNKNRNDSVRFAGGAAVSVCLPVNRTHT